MGGLTQINADFFDRCNIKLLGDFWLFLCVGFLTAEVGGLTQVNAEFFEGCSLKIPDFLKKSGIWVFSEQL